jgi:uncharacterized protein YdaU (DUF1376 family)
MSKNRLPYYKAYPRDFIEGTIGMTFELKSAYRLILDLIYMQSGELPDDARYISGLLGCSVRKWKSIRNELVKLGKIQCENDIISNFRADKELETLSKLQDKQRENRSRPNKNNDLETPRCDQPEPEPEPYKNTKKKSCPLELETMFLEWGEIYPKDVRGLKAKTEFEKALERIPFESLKDKTEQYADLCESENREPRHIREAKNWLADSAWTELEEIENPWIERMKVWQDKKQWMPHLWGAEPDQPNTKVPKEFING